MTRRPGNHTDVDTPDQCRPAGRLAEGSRHAPRTTFYPCQSLWGLGTQYCVRQRRHDNRSSEAPHLSKRWVHHPEPSRALRSTSQQRLCAACLPWLPASPATQHPLSGDSLLARRTVRLEWFQAGALRNRPALHIPPEGNEQTTGQGHDTNAPHALAAQSKAGIEPEAEGRVGLIA